ncbi:phage tail protein [Streptomyces noursei]|uniref:phage tail protein n=1 Tax=Streptomyces noursei TaxID=1971 RepID=UPI003816E7E1
MPEAQAIGLRRERLSMNVKIGRSAGRRAERSVGAVATVLLGLGAVAGTATSASAASIAVPHGAVALKSEALSQPGSELDVNGQVEHLSEVVAMSDHDITVRRGANHSGGFDDWINAALNNSPDAKRNFRIVRYDANNRPTLGWQFTDGWVSKVADGELITINLNRVEVVRP